MVLERWLGTFRCWSHVNLIYEHNACSCRSASRRFPKWCPPASFELCHSTPTVLETMAQNLLPKSYQVMPHIACTWPSFCWFDESVRSTSDLTTPVPGNSIMQALDLAQNGIGDRGAAALAEAIRLNTTLTKLDLSGNAIDINGASALPTCQSESPWCLLQHLNSVLISYYRFHTPFFLLPSLYCYSIKISLASFSLSPVSLSQRPLLDLLLKTQRWGVSIWMTIMLGRKEPWPWQKP